MTDGPIGESPWQAPPPGAPAPQPPAPPGWGSPPPPGQQGWGTPPPYGQPPPAPPGYPTPYGFPPAHYQASSRTNGLAIASMVLGILWIWWIGSVLALVFGYIAKRQIAERREAGGGMATAGIVLGWIGVGTLLLAIIAGVMAGASID
ncbi:MAG: DUF4190 domain-containing protein [Mycobacteriales bacterium]|nr:DUF4190 domain-containing protein [Frankia sp.]